MLIAAGLLAATLFTAGMLLAGELLGAFGDSDQVFLDIHSDRRSRITAIVAGYLLGACGLALLVFFERVLAHWTIRHEAEPFTLRVARAAEVAGVALFLAGVAALVTVSAAKTFGGLFGDEALQTSAVAIAPQLGTVLVLHYSMWAFALAIASISIQAQRTAAWPRWLILVSFGTVPCLLVSSALYLPVASLPIWICCVALRAGQVANQSDAASAFDS